MKAQRRQELKTNELAETLRQAKEFLERYATYVTGGAIVVAVVLIGSLWYRSSLTSRHRRQWEDYYNLEQAAVQLVFGQAGDPQAPGGEGFDTLVARHKTLVSSASEPLVRLRTLEALGDFCWMYALRGPDTGSGSEADAQALEECAAAYEQIKRDFPDDAWAVGNAMMTLAVIAEERGDFDRAEEIYRQIESDQRYAQTTLVDSAQEALARLDDLRVPIVFAPPAPPPAQAGPATTATAPAATALPPPGTEPVEVTSAAAAAPTEPDGGSSSPTGTSPSPPASESPTPPPAESAEGPAQPPADPEQPQPSATDEGESAAP